MAGMYMGVVCFADKVILIAISHQATQAMLNEVETICQSTWDSINHTGILDVVPSVIVGAEHVIAVK